MRSHEFLDESINDKGLFKSVFLAGLPGSGKSTVINRITDGAVAPRLVNTDKSYEFLLKKNNTEATSAAWKLFGTSSKTINANMLYHYINGMLPMFIDGTSANAGSLLKRSGILESLGYDTALIWVDTNLDEAIKRAGARERKVDANFIIHLHKQMEKTKVFYKQRFGSNFIEVDNNGNNFSDMETKTFNIANTFFTSPIQNPIGVQTVEKLKESNEKYLIPNIFNASYIKRLVDMWYK